MFHRNKKLFFQFLIFLIITLHTVYSNPGNTILFLPFTNEGNYLYDRLKTYIPNYLYEPIKYLPEYNAIPCSRVYEYMIRKGYKEKDLKKITVIESIMHDFHADVIINGFYCDEDIKINISFDIYRYIENDIEVNHSFKSVKPENLNAIALSDTFDELLPVCESVTNIKPDPGFLLIKTNPICILYIDDVPIGRTPIRLPLGEGTHRVKIIFEDKDHYKDEIIMDDKVNIIPGETHTEDIDIFKSLEINAEEPCTVYINDTEKGNTPFHTTLFWGRDYRVKVVYKDGEKDARTIYTETIDTKNPITPLYFPVTGAITMDLPRGFKGSIDGQLFVSLPYTYNNLEPGTYSLQISVNDPEREMERILYDKSLLLSPFQISTITMKNIDFKKNWGFAFLPTALQFYNHEPTKGSILLSVVAGSALVAGYTAYMWNYYDDNYNNLITEADSMGKDDTGIYAKMDEINDALDLRNRFLFFTISGIVTFASACIYSAADGIITMNHIYDLIY